VWWIQPWGGGVFSYIHENQVAVEFYVGGDPDLNCGVSRRIDHLVTLDLDHQVSGREALEHHELGAELAITADNLEKSRVRGELQDVGRGRRGRGARGWLRVLHLGGGHYLMWVFFSCFFFEKKFKQQGGPRVSGGDRETEGGGGETEGGGGGGGGSGSNGG